MMPDECLSLGQRNSQAEVFLITHHHRHRRNKKDAGPGVRTTGQPIKATMPLATDRVEKKKAALVPSGLLIRRLAILRVARRVGTRGRFVTKNLALDSGQFECRAGPSIVTPSAETDERQTSTPGAVHGAYPVTAALVRMNLGIPGRGKSLIGGIQASITNPDCFWTIMSHGVLPGRIKSIDGHCLPDLITIGLSQTGFCHE
jgi:hypothetical protein